MEQNFKDKLVAIDFEYKDLGCKYKLVCASVFSRMMKKPFTFWLTGDTSSFVLKLESLRDKGYTLVAHAVEKAEARCVCELGLDPRDFRWFDTFLTARCLTNSNKLIRKKVIGNVEGEELLESDDAYWSRELNLLACFRRWHIQHAVEGEEKEAMRSLIIDGTDESIEADRMKISAYCESDVADLLTLAEAELDDYKSRLSSAVKLWSRSRMYGRTPEQHILSWGYAASYGAVIWKRGIPVWRTEFEKFLTHGRDVVNSEREAFGKKYDGSVVKGSLNMKFIQDSIGALGITKWPKTETGSYRTDNKTLETYDNSSPFLADLRQFKRIQSDLHNFTAEPTKRRAALSSFYKDGRVHATQNFLGTQTARAGATPSSGFVPGFSKVLRTLITPQPGKCLVGLDFSGEENALMAAWSRDSSFKRAYCFGDFYLGSLMEFGMIKRDVYDKVKASGENPKDHFRNSRNLIKPILLGLGFGRGAEGIFEANRKSFRNVNAVSGLVEKYHGKYHVLEAARNRLKEYVERRRMTTLCLPNGWLYAAFRPSKDTRSVLSVLNLPIQGAGSCILYRSLERMGKKVDVDFCVHDELCAECRSENVPQMAEFMRTQMLSAVEDVAGIDWMKLGEPEINDGSGYVYHDDDAKGSREAAWKRLLSELEEVEVKTQLANQGEKNE